MPPAPAPPLGIIMLDTAFVRPPGDVGHAASWPVPVLFETVPGATARRIVGGQDCDLADAFVQAGERLRARGAVGVITSCGFLAARQRSFAARRRFKRLIEQNKWDDALEIAREQVENGAQVLRLELPRWHLVPIPEHLQV